MLSWVHIFDWLVAYTGESLINTSMILVHEKALRIVISIMNTVSLNGLKCTFDVALYHFTLKQARLRIPDWKFAFIVIEYYMMLRPWMLQRVQSGFTNVLWSSNDVGCVDFAIPLLLRLYTLKLPSINIRLRFALIKNLHDLILVYFVFVRSLLQDGIFSH